jgi:hypothetical protein
LRAALFCAAEPELVELLRVSQANNARASFTAARFRQDSRATYYFLLAFRETMR